NKSDFEGDKKVSKKTNQNSLKKDNKKSEQEDLNESFNISQKELIKRVQEELKKSNYNDEFSSDESYDDKANDKDTSSQKKETKQKSSLKQKWRDFINEDDDEFSIFSSYKEKDKHHDSKEDTIDVVKSTDIDTRSFENTLNTPKITVKDIEEYEKNKEKDESSNNKSSKNKSNNVNKEIKNNTKPEKEKKSSEGFLNKFKKRDSKKDSAVSKEKTSDVSKEEFSSDKAKVKEISFNRDGKNQGFYDALSTVTNKISLLNNNVSNYIGALGSKNSKMVLGLGALLTVIQIIIGQHGFNFALIIAIVLKLLFDYIEFYFPLNIAIERDEIYVSDYEIKKSSLINWIICKVFLFVAFIISPFGGFFKFNLLASLTAMPFATVILIILSLLIALSQFKEEFKDRSSINFIGWYALSFILFELLFKMIWFLINFIFVTLL
ncbi:zinc ribbon domain-containing protein, partial [Peptoniphilus sp.]|uniref:zinc ribbon domain-containing protein n=1 Tax=Peptoniphilus sp. TaxID=1971214 RepID=UPI003D8BE647